MKRKRSHGRYAMYAQGCRCARCVMAMRRAVRKRFNPKRPRTRRDDINTKISLSYMRRNDKNRSRGIAQVFKEEVHPKFMEGKRTARAKGAM